MIRSSARATLALPAALRIASNRAQQGSECLAPAAGRCARTPVHVKQPAACACSSRSSRVSFTRRGAVRGVAE
eukprot:6465604-Alexandrium_andersonii.AAC.1